MNKKLEKEFERIKENHRNAIRLRSAKTVLGPSMVRFLGPKGTKDKLVQILYEIKLDELLKHNSQNGYKRWFEENLGKIAGAIKNGSSGHRKWAHATKVLDLYLYDIVLNSHFFDDNQAEKIVGWLYTPIDKTVLSQLRKLVGERFPTQLKDVDTEEKFYKIQDVLGEAAKEIEVPRVWFDDIWAEDD